jgi:hypothetical protein
MKFVLLLMVTMMMMTTTTTTTTTTMMMMMMMIKSPQVFHGLPLSHEHVHYNAFMMEK